MTLALITQAGTSLHFKSPIQPFPPTGEAIDRLKNIAPRSLQNPTRITAH